MFCRISGGWVYQGAVRYYPFRLTPYRLTLRDSEMAAAQPCCLLIAERVHSGYEGKLRLFTAHAYPSPWAPSEPRLLFTSSQLPVFLPISGSSPPAILRAASSRTSMNGECICARRKLARRFRTRG